MIVKTAAELTTAIAAYESATTTDNKEDALEVLRVAAERRLSSPSTEEERTVVADARSYLLSHRLRG